MGLILFVVVVAPLLFGAPLLFLYGLHKRSQDAKQFKSGTTANVLIAAGALGMVGEAIALWNLAHTNMSKGRLLRIQGRTRTAKTREGSGWSLGVPPLGESDLQVLSQGERAILGAAWLRAAELEHASIAAFSQLSLRLMELGAPSDLVKRAHQAALEEVSHAEACFAVAAILNQAQREPDALSILSKADRTTRERSLARLVRGSLIDGALGEGVAARVALRSSQGTNHETLGPLLAKIAMDEAKHAELAWDTIEWALREGGIPAQLALRSASEELVGYQTATFPAFANVRVEVLARYGIPPDAVIEAASNEVLEEVRARVSNLLGVSSVQRVAA